MVFRDGVCKEKVAEKEGEGRKRRKKGEGRKVVTSDQTDEGIPDGKIPDGKIPDGGKCVEG